MTTLLAFVCVVGIAVCGVAGQDDNAVSTWDGVWRGPDCSAEVQNCMECICGVESSGNLRGCGYTYGNDAAYCSMGCNRRDRSLPLDEEENPCVCGPYQISKRYFEDCSEPDEDDGESRVRIGSWSLCTRDQSCARQCVYNYLKKHREECFGTPWAGQVSCRDHWRLHRNGPEGCLEPAAGEGAVDSCCSTPALRCKTEESCLAWMCGMASNDGRFQCGTQFFNDGEYGVYQISAQYFEQCSDTAAGYSVPIANRVACTADVECATICVQNYIKRYAELCFDKDAAELTCLERAAIHHGGPRFCRQPSKATERYLRRVQDNCQTPVNPNWLL